MNNGGNCFSKDILIPKTCGKKLKTFYCSPPCSVLAFLLLNSGLTSTLNNPPVRALPRSGPIPSISIVVREAALYLYLYCLPAKQLILLLKSSLVAGDS